MGYGTITDVDRKYVETWENIAPQGNAIIRLDSRGIERQELIQNQRTFLITTEERVITQDRIVDVRHDPFLNGCFRPVVVPDKVTIQSNPNAIGDDEILSLFQSSDIAWAEWMKVIDSPETLRRMLDLADQADNLTLKRYKEIAGRLAEVKPKTRITSKDQEAFEALATTPGGAPAPARGQGGRSRDYRTD